MHDNSTAGGQRLNGILAKGSHELPLVSVVTAVFNGEPYLAGCLESVLTQNYPNIEHIIVDGGSTDGTLDVLRQYNDRVALWRSEPDKGVYDAWNKALDLARGEWICFLGVDDEFLPGAVSAYMALAAKYPKVEYLSSKVKWLHPSGYSRTIGGPWNWRRFSRFMCTAHVGSMHRRSMYTRLGTYDTSYRSAADYELLLRARHELIAEFLPMTTVLMRAGGVSGFRKALDEQARAKIVTGRRNRILTALELQIANLKFFLRPIRHTLGKITVR